MTEPFTGTQAQLADELDRWADEASDRGMVIIARTYTNAAGLVRNAALAKAKGTPDVTT